MKHSDAEKKTVQTAHSTLTETKQMGFVFCCFLL